MRVACEASDLGRAVERPLREFDNEIEFHRFLDDALQPLAEEFDARVVGGSLSYGGGSIGTFDIGSLSPRPDDYDAPR
jgi:hypothetical protein